ncbi:MAG: hypothetical protein ABI891_01425 [Acidobacteriota bacterium]
MLTVYSVRRTNEQARKLNVIVGGVAVHASLERASKMLALQF